MTDLLNVGARSLVNIQQMLGTAGHNIANVNTEGYSRQTVNVVTQEAQRYGFGYVGQGATIGSIDRAFDGFLNNHLYRHTNEQAVRHLFRVASSLDSMVVGEPQVLGQVRHAYSVAVEAGTAGRVLNRLVHHTLRVAKRFGVFVRRLGVDVAFGADDAEVGNAVGVEAGGERCQAIAVEAHHRRRHLVDLRHVRARAVD